MNKNIFIHSLCPFNEASSFCCRKWNLITYFTHSIVFWNSLFLFSSRSIRRRLVCANVWNHETFILNLSFLFKSFCHFFDETDERDFWRSYLSVIIANCERIVRLKLRPWNEICVKHQEKRENFVIVTLKTRKVFAETFEKIIFISLPILIPCLIDTERISLFRWNDEDNREMHFFKGFS